jgi:hypothetical protein
MEQLNFVRFVRWLCEHVDEPVGDVLESPVVRFLRSVGANDEEWWAPGWVADFVVALGQLEGKVEVTGGDCLEVLERLAE